MNAPSHRLAHGGRIQRSRVLNFEFDGMPLTGHPGDTLASALLANGVRIVGRSFKRHRPRGVIGIGVEECNALVQVGEGERVLPNVPATLVELYDGLKARSLNCWPNARFDAAGIVERFSQFLPAGFYGKTFMWPSWAWYERFIRRAAGIGRAPQSPDPDRYERRFDHYDVAIVGAGPSGLAAAVEAGATGERVLLLDENSEPGGQLQWTDESIANAPAAAWLDAQLAALRAMPNVRLLARATAFGCYDHHLLGIAERVTDHLPVEARPRHLPRLRLWKVRAKRVVLATGSLERPLVFAGNDLPGIMLASAAAGYALRFGVRAGQRAVIFTNNDSAYEAARVLADAGVAIVAIVDMRKLPDIAAHINARLTTVLMAGAAVVAARGGRAVREVLVARLDAHGIAGPAKRIECDLVCMSGGWNPTVHLHSQAGGSLVFDDARQCFVPGGSSEGYRSIGACSGAFDVHECIEQGRRAIAGSAKAHAPHGVIAPLREIPAPRGFDGKTKFVDFLNDATAADLALAAHEGYRASEHAKRYTTAGMGVDQGKTGNVNVLAILGVAQHRTPGKLGTTTFRPPYTPVAFGAFAGRDVGAMFDTLRRTPITEWHEQARAVFEPVGRWRRPMYYPRDGESMDDAVRRECLAARQAVGICDVSTLGKIELKGPDAVRLLDMLYINRWSNLAVGRCRYGVMLKDDGMVFDDGTTSRLGEHHYFMTTTSGHADAVAGWIEEWLQCEWPMWRVYSVPVTTQWAAIMVSGPRARELLQRVGSSIDLDRDACRFMTVHEGTVAGMPCRLLRVSFTGELSYELYVPAGYGHALWEILMTRGHDLGIAPIGTEALHVLRAEKGFFVVGHDTDATVSPLDLGIAAMIDPAKPDFIGKRSLSRLALTDAGRKQFVGLTTGNASAVVPEGSPIVEVRDAGKVKRPPVPMAGRVTSSYFSPTLSRGIAFGLVSRGLSRMGEAVVIVDHGVPRTAFICSPRFYDPEGKRLHG